MLCMGTTILKIAWITENYSIENVKVIKAFIIKYKDQPLTSGVWKHQF